MSNATWNRLVHAFEDACIGALLIGAWMLGTWLEALTW